MDRSPNCFLTRRNTANHVIAQSFQALFYGFGGDDFIFNYQNPGWSLDVHTQPSYVSNPIKVVKSPKSCHAGA
jgi:hypothetical protein